MLPILYQSPELTLYSYPLLMGLGWGLAYQIYFSLQPPRANILKAQILFWGVFISAWLGAKILFYITIPESAGQNLLQQMSFWTGGGFVFYGGFIGGLLFISLFRLFDRELSIKALWPMLPALAFGHGTGRVGCFLAGCCYGKPTEFFWGVYMHDHHRHPTQLLEAAGLFLLGLYLIRSKASRSTLVGVYLALYGILRFGVEILRGDEIRGTWGFLTPSQWISVALLITGIGILFLGKFNGLTKSKSN